MVGQTKNMKDGKSIRDNVINQSLNCLWAQLDDCKFAYDSSQEVNTIIASGTYSVGKDGENNSKKHLFALPMNNVSERAALTFASGVIHLITNEKPNTLQEADAMLTEINHEYMQSLSEDKQRELAEKPFIEVEGYPYIRKDDVYSTHDMQSSHMEQEFAQA